MSKEWVLNMATNRWGLNKKSSVGPVSAWIRECAPRSVSEWERFYLRKLASFLTEKSAFVHGKGLPTADPSAYLEALGRKLYVKVSEVLHAEIEQVGEDDCIDYIRRLVIGRTFEGYLAEKETVYGRLQRRLDALGVRIEPASDELDRLYNVDFVIPVGDKMIGLQIKPETWEHAPEAHKWFDVQKGTHGKFEENFGGPVFLVVSVREGKKKVIWHEEETVRAVEQSIKALLER